MGTVKYSTGPIDNEGVSIYATDPIYSTVTVSILNNNNDEQAQAKIILYELNGEKTQVDTEVLNFNPQVSKKVTLDVSSLDTFEIQVVITQEGGPKKVQRRVLWTATGKDEIGEFVSYLPITVIGEN